MRPTPYATVVRDPRVGRLLPGFAASYLGDGMSAIAVSWLALQIAPPGHGGLAVAMAVAAYSFPAAIGTFALAAPLRGRPGTQLVTWDSCLRAGSLGAIAATAALGALTIWSFVALLAVSSFLHAWGSAGTYTMVTELLPEQDHLPANALLGMLAQFGVLLGPALAGTLIAWHGPATVLALDALSFTTLALSCRLPARPRPAKPSRPEPARPGAAALAKPSQPEPACPGAGGLAKPSRPEPARPGAAGLAKPSRPEPARPRAAGSAEASRAEPARSGAAGSAEASRAGFDGLGAGSAEPARIETGSSGTRGSAEPSPLAGFRLLFADRRLAGLLALTFGCFTLYGPFEVGLPVYIADYQHAPASHLAWYFTAFGAGAVVGGLAAGYLRSWPLGPTTAGIVFGVGTAFLPLGLGASDLVSVACYALAGLIFAPYGSLTTALLQRRCEPSSVAQVLAAQRTVMILSGPVGAGLGGLLVTGFGVRPAFLVAAAGTVALGVSASAAQLPGRRSAAGTHPPR